MLENRDLCLELSDAIDRWFARNWLGRWFGRPARTQQTLGTPWAVDPDAPTRLDLARPTPIVCPERKI